MHRVKLVDLPDEIVHDSVPYKQLYAEIVQLRTDTERMRQQLEQVLKESNELREMQEKWREGVLVGLAGFPTPGSVWLTRGHIVNRRRRIP